MGPPSAPSINTDSSAHGGSTAHAQRCTFLTHTNTDKINGDQKSNGGESNTHTIYQRECTTKSPIPHLFGRAQQQERWISALIVALLTAICKASFLGDKRPESILTMQQPAYIVQIRAVNNDLAECVCLGEL